MTIFTVLKVCMFRLCLFVLRFLLQSSGMMTVFAADVLLNVDVSQLEVAGETTVQKDSSHHATCILHLFRSDL